MCHSKYAFACNESIKKPTRQKPGGYEQLTQTCSPEINAYFLWGQSPLVAQSDVQEWAFSVPCLHLDLSQDALSPSFLQQDFFASSDFLQQDSFASSDFLQQDFFASSESLQQGFFASDCSSASIELETVTDSVADSGASWAFTWNTKVMASSIVNSFFMNSWIILAC